ncbi:glycoside hydrolase family 43 protein [Anaerocolumna sp. MB42-C2]|uniref:glycoside hydrolase family 43 protein n=1 Tax=Anaerocolumna sp. MB42-C2 TaxID=3070997 RepID=UPI0027E020F1|nr:glycoside hydrolase family 43 protein [Anaerocolumna sp. MB42-C2]WMJ86207.1 glycoside hydrolase family 43 protein [Anaerocolumna sp. MB42-C2]
MKSYTTLELITTEEKLFFQNDLGITQIGDPFILKASDDTYYLYCTSASNGYYCWKSKDLVNWSGKNLCYIKKSDSWCIDSFWAPEVVEYNHKYYMYYSARNSKGSLRIGLALSNKPDGPFEDVKNAPLFDLGYAAIDANVLIDDDGSKYLYFSRDCSENGIGDIKKSEIYGVPLNDDMLSIKGEPLLLITPAQKWEMASVNPLWNEGPEVIKHNNTYYLSYSANCYANSSYSVGYATSSSPLGPFEKYNHNPILTSGTQATISGPGHHSFTVSPDGTEIWMAYHTHTDPKTGGGNRKLNIDKVLFTRTGEMYVDGPTLCSQPIPSDGSYANVTGKADITGVSDPQLLTDGIFTLHKGDSRYDCTIPVAEDVALVTLQFKEPVKVSNILVYRGVNKSQDFSKVKAVLDDRYITEEYSLSENTDERAAILNFNEQTVKKIELILTPKASVKELGLSEIMVIKQN